MSGRRDQYKKCANLLEAVHQLMDYFQQYESIPKVRTNAALWIAARGCGCEGWTSIRWTLPCSCMACTGRLTATGGSGVSSRRLIAVERTFDPCASPASCCPCAPLLAQVKNLSRRLETVQTQLQAAVLDDFKILMGQADVKLSAENLDRLANACLVVDALGPRVRSVRGRGRVRVHAW